MRSDPTCACAETLPELIEAYGRFSVQAVGLLLRGDSQTLAAGGWSLMRYTGLVFGAEFSSAMCTGVEQPLTAQLIRVVMFCFSAYMCGVHLPRMFARVKAGLTSKGGAVCRGFFQPLKPAKTQEQDKDTRAWVGTSLLGMASLTVVLFVFAALEPRTGWGVEHGLGRTPEEMKQLNEMLVNAHAWLQWAGLAEGEADWSPPEALNNVGEFYTGEFLTRQLCKIVGVAALLGWWGYKRYCRGLVGGAGGATKAKAESPRARK